MKKINKIMALLMAAAFAVMSVPAMAAAETSETSQSGIQETPAAVEDTEANAGKVAGSSEMTSVDKVTEEGMTPVYGGQIEDGTYPVEVKSSSSMFRITKAELTVEDGEMTAVMTMGGKGYLYVYMGTGEEAAAADASEYISYAEDADGAHTFTVSVEALDQAVSCAAFSKKKEKWYDRSLCFLADSLPASAIKESEIPDDGEYTAAVTLSGGTGRATIESPARLTVKDGSVTATIIWSSPNYDYMIVGGERYLPIELESVENSAFEIPVAGFDFDMPVKADTVAMSEPHEIAYTLNFDSASLTGTDQGVPLKGIAGIAVIVLIAVIAGIAVGRRIAAKKIRDK